ncbi:MAG: rubredoxin [Gammaproteobacteria bacterium]
MMYICIPCGFIYDEDHSEVSWDELPDEWQCPDCGSGKKHFVRFEIDLTNES